MAIFFLHSSRNVYTCCPLQIRSPVTNVKSRYKQDLRSWELFLFPASDRCFHMPWSLIQSFLRYFFLLDPWIFVSAHLSESHPHMADPHHYPITSIHRPQCQRQYNQRHMVATFARPRTSWWLPFGRRRWADVIRRLAESACNQARHQTLSGPQPPGLKGMCGQHQSSWIRERVGKRREITWIRTEGKE